LLSYLGKASALLMVSDASCKPIHFALILQFVDLLHVCAFPHLTFDRYMLKKTYAGRGAVERRR
jgi:hypothetical protein